MAFIPVYILILFVTIIIDYIAGILIEKAEGSKKKMFLGISLVANIGILAVFKYYNFFIDNMQQILNVLNIHGKLGYLEIILPIGLSFHTFQAMSYTFEVYYGKQKAEKHLGIYALYVMYYPQLVAGPIERPQNILPQLKEEQSFVPSRVTSGLILMLWGMVKKVVIADRLSFFVDRVFNNPESYEGPSTITAILFFAFQIYCDFSGYSDIARGASRVMGIELMTNFKQPYLSTSIHEFWKRWHISLSTWFRDYVYIPLGGNRKGKLIWYRNLFIIFLISGFWHGASWNFIIWGALHGIFVIAYHFIFSSDSKQEHTSIISQIGGWIVTFTLVCIAWVFFRSSNLENAMHVFANLSTGWYKSLHIGSWLVGYPVTTFLIATSLIGLLTVLDYLQEKVLVENFVMKKPALIRYSVYYLLIGMIYILGIYTQSSFIYFQF